MALFFYRAIVAKFDFENCCLYNDDAVVDGNTFYAFLDNGGGIFSNFFNKICIHCCL